MLLPKGSRIRGLHPTATAQSVGHLLADVFEVGGTYPVRSAATVRSGESLDSDFVTELAPGTIVRIVELGTHEQRRAKVLVDSFDGWLSLATRKGELLLDAETVPKCANCMYSLVAGTRGMNAGRVGGVGLDAVKSAPSPLEVAIAFSIISDFQLRIQLRHDNVQKLPTFVFGAASCASEGKFEPTCSVCLQDLGTGELIKQLPCEHLFHAGCIDHWLKKSDICPFRCHVNLLPPTTHGVAG